MRKSFCKKRSGIIPNDLIYITTCMRYLDVRMETLFYVIWSATRNSDSLELRIPSPKSPGKLRLASLVLLMK